MSLLRTARLLGACIFALAGACSETEPKTETAPPERTPDHVWSGQVKALDKARALEQATEKRAQEQEQVLDAQSR